MVISSPRLRIPRGARVGPALRFFGFSGANGMIGLVLLRERTQEILGTTAVGSETGEAIGLSRDGKPIRAHRFGGGTQRVSLLGGCHADEPVGPRLLLRLCRYLSELPEDDPLMAEYEWWIVPHINPDGAERNRCWQSKCEDEFELVNYLSNRLRELPGDDIEFGFPRGPDDTEARPENAAVYEWWEQAGGDFSLHVSLHGMGFAAGPWFLIEAEWKDRCRELKKQCVTRVEQLGYALHDVERNGEKGFFRLGRGFCTRPDSKYMRRHFLDLGDEQTAALFRPSSMETIRAFGGDPLTLVSEMPLFVTPGVGEQLGPPDPVAEDWKNRIEEWTAQLKAGDSESSVIEAEAEKFGLRAMPIHDQMELQWTFIAAGLEQVQLDRERSF